MKRVGSTGLAVGLGLGAPPATWAQQPAAADQAQGPASADTASGRVAAKAAEAMADVLGPGHWRLVVSPYTKHYNYNPEHRRVWALGIERQGDDGWLAGASYFRNSFGQPSGYVYGGRRFENLLGQQKLFGQFTAGVMYGYREPWAHKVPMNVNGFSPGALLSAGWQFTPRQAVTVHLLGDAGVMLQWSLDLR